MNNLICWRCEIEKTFKGYLGTKLLDENGNKPCYQCYLEEEADKDSEREDHEHEEDSECS